MHKLYNRFILFCDIIGRMAKAKGLKKDFPKSEPTTQVFASEYTMVNLPKLSDQESQTVTSVVPEESKLLKTNSWQQDPQELLESFLKQNNLKLDFDVLEGTIPTKFGFIKLSEPTLVVKASYVGR